MKAILPDGVYETPAGDFVVNGGNVRDVFGNYLFPAPRRVEELPDLWEEYCKNYEEAVI